MAGFPSKDREAVQLQAELERRQWRPRGPRKVSQVMSSLLAKRGYARQQSGDRFAEAWRAAAKRLAAHSRPGNLRGGVLEIFVRNSTMLQELKFQERKIVAALCENLRETTIKKLRFRVGGFDVPSTGG